MARANFLASVVDALGKRVGQFCSNPDCGRPTTGPHTEPDNWVNVGVAAHIHAASPGGPRSNPNLSPEQISDATNGIWLCYTCSKLIDDDPVKYTPELLRSWKADAEAGAEQKLTKSRTLDAPRLPLAVSAPLKIGIISYANIPDDRIVPILHIGNADSDPTLISGAFAYRWLIRPTRADEVSILHGIGVDVMASEPVPEFKPRLGMYPAKQNVFLLPFGDPAVCGSSRFMATKHYQLRKGRPSEALSFQAWVLETQAPDVIDCRVAPQNPGLFSIRIFALASVGTSTAEQELLPPTTVLVPEPPVFKPAEND